MLEEQFPTSDFLKVLSSSNEVVDSFLEKIFQLSQVVFAKEFEEAAQEMASTGHRNGATDLVVWRNNLLHHAGEIVYTVKGADEVEEELTAFAFSFERVQSSVDNDNKLQRPLHIWIAGCHPLYRRRHLMKRIFDLLEERARAKGYTVLTVNTYPQKFEHMPKFLESQGFNLSQVIKNFESLVGSSGAESNNETIKYCYRKHLFNQ